MATRPTPTAKTPAKPSPLVKKRGFGSMTSAQKSRIARLGGLAVARTQDMRAIGRKGGKASQKVRAAARKAQ